MERPRKRHASLEPHKERRITKRRKASAHIRHEENEKYDDVHFLFSPRICPDQRTDQKHRRPGGSDPAGQYRTNQQKNRIYFRRSHQSAFQSDTPGNHKKPQKQNDKRNVIEEHRFEESVQSLPRTVSDGKRDDKYRRPCECYFQHVVLPPLRFYQRNDSDRQQHARKGDDTPDRQSCADGIMSGVGIRTCKYGRSAQKKQAESAEKCFHNLFHKTTPFHKKLKIRP